MRARFFDAASGSVRELRPTHPPTLRLSARGASGPRALSLDALRRALAFLGFELSDDAPAELAWGPDKPAVGLWLKPGPCGPASAAIKPEILRVAVLRTRYRLPFALDAEGLARAEHEWSALRAEAARLARASGAPSPSGLAGYMKRLRDALGDDFDSGAALDAVFDALRPGALSPASQREALKAGDAALGLGLF